MATQILAAGDTVTNSTAFALLDGETATVVLRRASAGRIQGADRGELQVETTVGWKAVKAVGWNRDNFVVAGEGNFRIRRLAGNWGADLA